MSILNGHEIRYLNVPYLSLPIIPNFRPYPSKSHMKGRNSDPKASKVKDFSSWTKSHSTQRGGGIDSDVVHAGMVPVRFGDLWVFLMHGLMVWLCYRNCCRCFFEVKTESRRIKIWYNWVSCVLRCMHISLILDVSWCIVWTKQDVVSLEYVIEMYVHVFLFCIYYYSLYMYLYIYI